jgi:uncharacterized protein with von Willebrand factor type A (vWA) domain
MKLEEARRPRYPLPQDPEPVLLGRILAFGRLLRRSGLRVTPSRVVDAVRSLDHVRMDRREEFHLALRMNLASSPEEERTFDHLFRRYWAEGGEPPVPRRRLAAESESAGSGAGSHALGTATRYSRLEALGSEAGAFSPPQEWIALERAIRRLVPRIATRPSRRRRPARRGRAIDLRRSFRRSLARGAELVSLARTARKVRRLRLLVLCDVSGSMDCHADFVLGSLLALQRAVPGSRTFVFSTKVTEVTDVLRRRSIPQALAELRGRVRHWSGGTHLAAALAFVNRCVTREAASRSTVCVIVSDGYDQGDRAPIGREMATLRRRARRLLWVNPLAATEGYEPIAGGMRAALPHVDDFLAVADVKSLAESCRTLKRTRREGRRTAEESA